MEENTANQSACTDSDAIAADMAENLENTPDAAAATSTLKKKLSLKTILFIAAACIGTIVLAVVFISRSRPESIAERFSVAWYDDEKTAMSLRAFDWEAYITYMYDGDEEAFFEYASDKYDIDIDSWGEYYKAADSEWKEYYEDEYGEYKITAEVKRSKDISVKKLIEDNEESIELLESRIAFDRDKITAAKLITTKAKLTGEDEVVRDKFEIYMAKVGGKWGVLDWSFVD